MFDFTTEQVEFLESSGKVVLHACPGSGKTTIVARKLANYLQCWNRPHQGIAVLSFTNVASDEIRHQATEMLPEGYCVDDPHFIGTLDSFIDNFIFLRFGYGENPEWCEMAEQPQEDGDEMESGFLFGSFFVAFSGVIRMGMD